MHMVTMQLSNTAFTTYEEVCLQYFLTKYYKKDIIEKIDLPKKLIH